MTEVRHGAIVAGTPLRDAAEPGHGIEPAACLVCQATDPRKLTRVNLTPPELARAGLPAGRAAVLCLHHLETAMRRIGTPTPAGNQGRCIACPGDDPARFGVVAAWPPQSGIPVTQPTYRACGRHLAEAVATLVTEHEQEITA